MKKNLIYPLLLVSAISIASVSQAQNIIEKGTVMFNAGVGIGSEYNSAYYKQGLGTKAALEVGMWQAGPGVVTLGAQAGATFSNGGGSLNNYKTHTFVVGGRSAWHHGWNVKGLDTYAGLSAGAGFNQYSYLNNESLRVKQNEVVPVFGGFVGASYFITPSFGINIEAGRDITQVQGGIVLKIK